MENYSNHKFAVFPAAVPVGFQSLGLVAKPENQNGPRTELGTPSVGLQRWITVIWCLTEILLTSTSWNQVSLLLSKGLASEWWSDLHCNGVLPRPRMKMTSGSPRFWLGIATTENTTNLCAGFCFPCFLVGGVLKIKLDSLASVWNANMYAQVCQNMEGYPTIATKIWWSENTDLHVMPWHPTFGLTTVYRHVSASEGTWPFWCHTGSSKGMEIDQASSHRLPAASEPHMTHVALIWDNHSDQQAAQERAAANQVTCCLAWTYQEISRAGTSDSVIWRAFHIPSLRSWNWAQISPKSASLPIWPSWAMAEVAPSPFTIHVPDDVLEDLRLRLQRARLVPDNVGAGLRDPNGAWSYGTDKVTLEEYVLLGSSWGTPFWRRSQRKRRFFFKAGLLYVYIVSPINGTRKMVTCTLWTPESGDINPTGWWLWLCILFLHLVSNTWDDNRVSNWVSYVGIDSSLEPWPEEVSWCHGDCASRGSMFCDLMKVWQVLGALGYRGLSENRDCLHHLSSGGSDTPNRHPWFRVSPLRSHWLNKFDWRQQDSCGVKAVIARAW